MRTREEVIRYCLSFPDVYEDAPFHDDNWTVMRCRGNRKVFAWIFEREGNIWVNVKMQPQWREFWRSAFEAVIPAYHLNKEHWSSVILNGTVPGDDIRRMLGESFDLVKPKKKKACGKGNGEKVERIAFFQPGICADAQSSFRIKKPLERQNERKNDKK